MNKWIEKNEAVLKVGQLPLDFGEIQAKKAMEPLNNTIEDILYRNDDNLDSYEFKESFVKRVKDRETKKSYELENLDELFE